MLLCARAKLNLSLAVTGQRRDGYHTIDSIFHTVDFCDLVEVMPASAPSFQCEPQMGPPERNLALRAARAFFAEADKRFPVSIRIDKRIPPQAGLGGGSADAAAVLNALDTLFPRFVSRQTLSAIALSLGADVPFLLAGGTARARGIGEDILPLYPPEPFFFVILQPEGGLSTPEVYRAYDAMPKPPMVDFESAAQAICAGDISAFAAAAGNMLAPCAAALMPQIDQAVDDLYACGAIYAQMTGSGSAVFGMFENAMAAETARLSLHKKYPFCVCAVSA
ncbi:MAG: 4-(cytidine 5'-diphospho)-2-C-methyl-D-erythritol kinase [Clostridia bacterium]|nr:4-(cytidine 5'-diphospho)-2-C-methyl-D-erythritol kinase [Clostridia bacterium]